MREPILDQRASLGSFLNAPHEPSNCSKPLILIVDDDGVSRKMAAKSLSKHGFDGVEAADGLEALTVFQEARPDLVLLDVSMPNMDGFEACRQIRRLPRGSHTPIIMLTGHNDLESIQSAFQAGANDFTVKPVNYLILSQRLRYILRAKDTADRLHEHRTRLAHAQRIAKLGYWHWDFHNTELFCSEEALDMFGREPERNFEDFEEFTEAIHQDDRERFRDHLSTLFSQKRGAKIEYRVTAPEGERFIYQETEFFYNREGAPARLIGTVQDISQRRRAEAEIDNLSFFDSVTGLPNRFRFKKQLARLVAQSLRYRRALGLLSINLDHFRRVKVSLGYSASDELLRQVAERLSDYVRRGDYMGVDERQRRIRRREDQLARVGGDEFMIALSEINRPEDAARVADRICDALRKPFHIDGREIYLTASIGLSTCPHDSEEPESLLRYAEAATEHARDLGRDRYVFFTEDLNRRAMEELSLESALRKALENEEFLLHYQPKLRSTDEKPSGVEALLRWRRDGRVLFPGAFIARAEESGLIDPIGQWVLRCACLQSKRWRQAGFPDMRISVNLSAAQFLRKDLADSIAEIMAETGVDGQTLELEITESLLMQNVEESIALMVKLKDMGLRLTIDDFGTGYSSLSYLKRLPIDTLKIDRAFVHGLGSDADDASIVSATIALAHELGLTVVAEGVEREDQLQFLREHGCEEIQGYYFSKPLPPDELSDWLTSRLPQVEATSA